MRRIVLVVSMFLIVVGSKSQPGRKQITGILIGNLIDSATSTGIPSATIQLVPLNDSLTTRTFLTDKNGAFELTNISFGYYRIIFTSVGYNGLAIDSIHFRDERYDFNLGDIKMIPGAGEMQEVIIYAEKPLIESKDGKITYNVGESALSGSSSTSELLKNMPLISNDANGKILLKGKEPKILIDDKPTDLNAQQLADLLESLPGSSIEKIELMTNPPPQYASETGGVINIVTRKGRVGLTGRLNLFYGTRGEANLSANASYRVKKFTLNVNAGVGAARVKGEGNSFRQNFYADSNNYLRTMNEFINQNLRPNIRISSDYEFNKQHQLNVVLHANANYFENKNTTDYQNLNNLKELYRWSRRSTTTDGNNLNGSISATYTYKGKNPKEVLRVINQVNTGGNDNERLFYQLFFNPDETPNGIDSTQRQFIDNQSGSWSTRVNYDKPLNKKITLGTGGSIGSNSFDNLLISTFLRKSDMEFVDDPLLSKDFRFVQHIQTIRGNLTFDLEKKWRIVTGVQLENTKFQFDFTDTTPDYHNDYVNLLPNLTVRKEWESGWNTAIIYRKSVRRPGINELNPTIDFNDPYNLRFGNPTLLPQLAHQFDWNTGWYKGKYYVNASVGYNYVTDIIQSIRTLVPGSKTEVTFQNITHRNEYEASIWGGMTFSKKVRMNASAGYSHNQYSDYDKINNRYRDGGTFYTSLNYNYTISDRVSIDGVIRYNSIADAQGRSRSNVTQNLGLQTKWLNKQMTISLNLIDLFSQQQFTTTTYGKNFTLESESQSRTKNVRVSVSYNFRKNDKKVKKAVDKAKAPRK